jgi:hypothetical protein
MKAISPVMAQTSTMENTVVLTARWALTARPSRCAEIARELPMGRDNRPYGDDPHRATSLPATTTEHSLSDALIPGRVNGQRDVLAGRCVR